MPGQVGPQGPQGLQGPPGQTIKSTTGWISEGVLSTVSSFDSANCDYRLTFQDDVRWDSEPKYTYSKYYVPLTFHNETRRVYSDGSRPDEVYLRWSAPIREIEQLFYENYRYVKDNNWQCSAPGYPTQYCGDLFAKLRVAPPYSNDFMLTLNAQNGSLLNSRVMLTNANQSTWNGEIPNIRFELEKKYITLEKNCRN